MGPVLYEEVFTRDLEEMRKRTGDEGLVEDAVTAIREEFGTFDWIMEGILTRAGFRVDEKQVRSRSWVNWVCTRTNDIGGPDETPSGDWPWEPNGHDNCHPYTGSG